MTDFIGKLVEVFEISGRGCVALIEIDAGFCRIGDELKIGDRPWKISGIEMVKYNAEGHRRIAEGWKPPTGVLLAGAGKADLQPYVGTSISAFQQEDQEQ